MRTRNLLLGIVVFVVSVSESARNLFSPVLFDIIRRNALVPAHEFSRLGVTNVLQLSPPFPKPDTTKGAYSPLEGDHGCVKSVGGSWSSALLPNAAPTLDYVSTLSRLNATAGPY